MWLAVRIMVTIVTATLLVIFLFWLADQNSEDRSLGNRERIAANRKRIERNTDQLTGILGCLQRSRDPQSCLDRVAGPRGPGGTSGRMGRAGRRGTQGVAGVVGRRGAMGRPGTGRRGPRGARGPAGRDGQDGIDGRDGIDGVDGVDGTPGRMGPPGPGPTDAQVQAAINNYCAVHNDCRQEPFPTPDTPTETP